MTPSLTAVTRNANWFLLRYPYYASFMPMGGVSTLANGGTWRIDKRKFSSSSPRNDHHFDTHHFVQRLEREGLTRAQAEGIMNSMAEVIDESIRTMTRNMVTKLEHEKVYKFNDDPHFELLWPMREP